MKTTVAVADIISFLVTKLGRAGFVESTLIEIEESTGQLIAADRRNLAQWRSHKGNGIIKKTPMLRKRKANMERLQKALTAFSRSARTLIKEINQPETGPD